LRAGEDFRAELEDFLAPAFVPVERLDDFFAPDFFAVDFFALAFFEEEAAFRAPLGDFAALRLEDFFEDDFFLPEERVRFTSLLKRLAFPSERSIARPLRSNHSKNSSHSIASSVSSPL
jgi:hypothetical protein